jgi:hypothetical protein
MERQLKQAVMVVVSEEAIQATARIVGPHSAAAKALEDAARRRSAGEKVEFLKSGASLFVHGKSAK